MGHLLIKLKEHIADTIGEFFHSYHKFTYHPPTHPWLLGRRASQRIFVPTDIYLPVVKRNTIRARSLILTRIPQIPYGGAVTRRRDVLQEALGIY